MDWNSIKQGWCDCTLKLTRFHWRKGQKLADTTKCSWNVLQCININYTSFRCTSQAFEPLCSLAGSLQLFSPWCTAGPTSLWQNNRGRTYEARSWAGCCCCPASVWWPLCDHSCSESLSGSGQMSAEETCSLWGHKRTRRSKRTDLTEQRPTGHHRALLLKDKREALKLKSGIKHSPRTQMIVVIIFHLTSFYQWTN